MSLTLSSALATQLADVVTAAVDAGAGAGLLRVYTGTRPAGPDTAVTDQVLLAEFALPTPLAPAATAGVATWDFSTAPEATTVAAGTAAWFRILDSDETAALDGDVGTTAAPGDVTFDAVVWASGATVSLSEGTYTQPDGD